MFQSLQKGYTIEARDIDAAINNICEESLPLETNMTSFLHATCAHFQKLVTESQVYKEPDSIAKGDFEAVAREEETTDVVAEEEFSDLVAKEGKTGVAKEGLLDVVAKAESETAGQLPKKPSVRFMDFLDDSDG